MRAIRWSFRRPTSFTGAQMLEIFPPFVAELERSLNPDNRDLVASEHRQHQGGDESLRSVLCDAVRVHASLGVQREVARRPGRQRRRRLETIRPHVHQRHRLQPLEQRRRTGHTECTGAQAKDVHAVCSNGHMYFDTTIGRARYIGLLVRVEKRFSHRTQFLASYALGSFVGTNGTGTGTTEAPAAASSASTTTTGSRTTDHCRPISGIS